MTLHPIVVHFPIALLTLYSVLELLRWRWFRELSGWTLLKGVLVIVGSVGAFVALQTGELIERQFRGDAVLRPVVAAHFLWANITMWVYGVVALAYTLVLLEQVGILTAFALRWSAGRPLLAWVRRGHAVAAQFTQGAWVIPPALVGLVALTVTGALGGSLVYGHNVDPVVEFVYRLYGFSTQ